MDGNAERPTINDLIRSNHAEFASEKDTIGVRSAAFAQLFSNFVKWGYSDKDVTDSVVSRIASFWYPDKALKINGHKKRAWIKHVDRHLELARNTYLRQHYNEESDVLEEIPLPKSNPAPAPKPEGLGPKADQAKPQQTREPEEALDTIEDGDFSRISKNIDPSIFGNIEAPSFAADNDFCDLLGIPKEHRDE